MPKRNRTNEQRKQHGSAPVASRPSSASATTSLANDSSTGQPVVPRPVDDEVTRAAKMFADSVRAHEAADQAERDRARSETQQMLHHESLRANKQRAADLIKQLRGQAGSRSRMIEAEANYRAALAELQEFETGERPHWAPAVAAVAEGAEVAESADIAEVVEVVHDDNNEAESVSFPE